MLLSSLAVLGAAVAVRFFFVIYSPFLAGDSGEYEGIARNLLEGHGYSIRDGSPTVFRPPVYPLFIAGVYALLGMSLGIVLWIQSFMGGLGPLILYALGRRAVGETAALVGALLAGTYPHLAFYAGTILAENLSATLLVIVLLGVHVLVKGRPNPLVAGAVGAGSALTALTSPAWAALPVGIGALLALRHGIARPTALALLAMTLGYSAVIAPWATRNHFIFDAFVPFTVPQQGLALYLAAKRQPLYEYDYRRQADTDLLMRRWVDLYETRADQERELLGERMRLQDDMVREAVGTILADPVGYLRHRLQVVPALWIQPAIYASIHSFRPPFQGQNVELRGMVQRNDWGAAVIRAVVTVVYVGGLIIGLVAGIWRLRRRRWDLAVLSLPAAYVFVVHTPIWIEHRYSVPAHPFLWLIAAVGLIWIWNVVGRLAHALRHGGAPA